MIIADSGFWIALADHRDKYHSLANQKIKSLNDNLITSFPVMTEVCHILLQRNGVKAQLNFIQAYQRGAFEVFQIENHHKNRLFELMSLYADLPMDLADASMVLLAEHLGHGKILSTDKRDFHTYRWKQTKPFTNLLFD
ncbi:MAG: PIN domain-containing protein [Methylococcaceae bacterium]